MLSLKKLTVIAPKLMDYRAVSIEMKNKNGTAQYFPGTYDRKLDFTEEVGAAVPILERQS